MDKHEFQPNGRFPEVTCCAHLIGGYHRCGLPALASVHQGVEWIATDDCPNHPMPCRCEPPCIICGFNKHAQTHADDHVYEFIEGQPPAGTQSLGMIPSRLCDNASSEEEAAWKHLATGGDEVQNNSVDAEKGTVAATVDFPKDSSGSAAQPPLDDPTQFTTRSFAMVWNEGHSIRLINRDDPRKAISIPWDEISALRALLKGTYPVGGGEV